MNIFEAVSGFCGEFTTKSTGRIEKAFYGEHRSEELIEMRQITADERRCLHFSADDVTVFMTKRLVMVVTRVNHHLRNGKIDKRVVVSKRTMKEWQSALHPELREKLEYPTAMEAIGSGERRAASPSLDQLDRWQK